MLEVPDRLRFPPPPFAVDPRTLVDVDTKEIRGFLDAVVAWRLLVLEYVDSSSQPEAVSPAVKVELLSRLAPDTLDVPEAYRKAYNLSAFPTPLRTADFAYTSDMVLTVMKWRASVVDFLDDIIDAWNPPFSFDEYVVLSRFFGPDGQDHCHFCLRALEAEERRDHWKACPMVAHAHANWPASPF